MFWHRSLWCFYADNNFEGPLLNFSNNLNLLGLFEWKSDFIYQIVGNYFSLLGLFCSWTSFEFLTWTHSEYLSVKREIKSYVLLFKKSNRKLIWLLPKKTWTELKCWKSIYLDWLSVKTTTITFYLLINQANCLLLCVCDRCISPHVCHNLLRLTCTMYCK